MAISGTPSRPIPATDDVDEAGNPFERRNHPRDFVTVNLAAEYPLTKKWVALLELTSTWDAGRMFGPKANLQPTALPLLIAGDRIHGHGQILPGLGGEY